MSQSDEWFQLFQEGPQDPVTGARERFFTHRLSKLVTEDIQGRFEDGVKGSLQYVGGDRIGYSTAYCFLTHEDPGHHERLNGFRFHYQVAGAGGNGSRIVDKFMHEMSPTSTVQYPYEGHEDAVPYDTLYPGGTLLFAHQRAEPGTKPGQDTSNERYQLMGVRTIPAVEPGNEKVKWFYQRSGVFVAVHDDLGPICRLIVAAMHHRYAFITRELPGGKIGGIETAIRRGTIVLPEGNLP